MDYQEFCYGCILLNVSKRQIVGLINKKVEEISEWTKSMKALIVYGTCYGATKGTSEEIAKILREEKFEVKVVNAKESSTNDCLKKVQGKFVSFLGSDDLWMQQKLERQLAVLRGNEERLVWADGLIVNAEGIPTGETIAHYIGATNRSGRLFEELLHEHCISFQTLIFNAEYAKGLELDESLKYVSDHRFIVELSKKYSFYFINEPLAKYRVHGKNITSRDMAAWMKERIKLRQHFLNEYSSMMSTRTRADIYHKIGHAYAMLGYPLSAKHYYMKAFYANHFNPNSALYFILAATAGKKYSGESITKMYYRFLSRLA